GHSARVDGGGDGELVALDERIAHGFRPVQVAALPVEAHLVPERASLDVVPAQSHPTDDPLDHLADGGARRHGRRPHHLLSRDVANLDSHGHRRCLWHHASPFLGSNCSMYDRPTVSSPHNTAASRLARREATDNAANACASSATQGSLSNTTSNRGRSASACRSAAARAMRTIAQQRRSRSPSPSAQAGAGGPPPAADGSSTARVAATRPSLRVSTIACWNAPGTSRSIARRPASCSVTIQPVSRQRSERSRVGGMALARGPSCPLRSCIFFIAALKPAHISTTRRCRSTSSSSGISARTPHVRRAPPRTKSPQPSTVPFHPRRSLREAAPAT